MIVVLEKVLSLKPDSDRSLRHTYLNGPSLEIVPVSFDMPVLESHNGRARNASRPGEFRL